MSSKKARRKKAFLERQANREKERRRLLRIRGRYHQSVSIEEMAAAMGVKLR